MNEFSVSVLLTKDEYIAYNAARCRKNRRGVWLMLLFGAAMLGVGLSALLFPGKMPLPGAASMSLLILGLFLGLYPTVLAPWFDRMRSAAEYEEKPDLRQASVYTFSGDAVGVRNGCMEGSFRAGLITEVTKTAGLIGFSVGREAQVIVPFRLLDERQTAFLCKMKGDTL